MVSKKYLKKNIDWDLVYSYLKNIEFDFRKDVFNTVFENFSLEKAQLVTKDNCLVDGDSLFFFDKSNQVYFFKSSIDEQTNYVFFNWNDLKKKDKENLMYSKSKIRQLIKQDRENDMMKLTEDVVFGKFSSNLETKMLSCYKKSSFSDEWGEDFLKNPFGYSDDVIEEVTEVVAEESLKKSVDVFHKTCLILHIENYPPRFTFSVDTNNAFTKESKKEFDSRLDVLAEKYDLRHICGKYIYEKDLETSKNGGLFMKIKNVKFKKSHYSHMFKPDYAKLAL